MEKTVDEDHVFYGMGRKSKTLPPKKEGGGESQKRREIHSTVSGWIGSGPDLLEDRQWNQGKKRFLEKKENQAPRKRERFMFGGKEGIHRFGGALY